MKRIVSLVLLFVALCTCVQAQGDTNINPLVVARAFALKTPTHFDCNMNGSMLISNIYQVINMQFTIRKSDFAITNLVVNGSVIDLPEPIYSIPLGDGGVINNLFLNVIARTASGDYAGNGYIQKEIVLKDDRLTVEIRPGDIPQALPVDVAKYGNDIRLFIDDFTYGYGYGVTGDKFYAYLPPIGGKYHYRLTQGDGTPIGSGWLEPFRDVVTPDDAYVGITYIGNVIGVEFPSPIGREDWIGVADVNFDCSIPLNDGSRVSGKVIFTDAGAGQLEIVVSGQFWIYVQKATDNNGDMPYLELTDNSVVGQDWVETRVSTVNQRVGKVVITIIPKINDPRQRAWVNLHRYYGGMYYGGGKG